MMRRIAILTLLTIPAMVGAAERPPMPVTPMSPAVAQAVASAPAAMPAPVGLIANIEHRSTTSLNGAWHFIVDPYETGYYDYRYQPRRDGFFLDQKPATKSDLIPSMTSTPHAPCWCPATGTLKTRTSSSTKERSGTGGSSATRGNRGGASSCNSAPSTTPPSSTSTARSSASTRAASRPSPSRSRAGCAKSRQCVVIEVDNTRRSDAVPTVNTDWWNYGGLTRRVLLVEVPETSSRTTSCSSPGPRSTRSPAGCDCPARAVGRRSRSRSGGQVAHRDDGRERLRAGASAPPGSSCGRPRIRSSTTSRWRRDRSRDGAHRLPLDRGAGRRHPAQRPTDLPARRLRARGGAAAHADAPMRPRRRARCSRGSRR